MGLRGTSTSLLTSQEGQSADLGQVEGRKLTDIINERHENVKYLPGIRLPTNVVAHADLRTAVKDASALIFVVPHQVRGFFLLYVPSECVRTVHRELVQRAAGRRAAEQQSDLARQGALASCLSADQCGQQAHRVLT